MAMGAIELATIARSQDYSNIRHNETTKVMTDQSNLIAREQKDNRQRAKQVREGENPEWHNRRFDAKEKGSNQYSGDGGQGREKFASRERVIRKGQSSFDIKI